MATGKRLTDDTRFGYTATQRWRVDYYLITGMVNPDSELEAQAAGLPPIFSIPFGDGCAVDANERVKILGLQAGTVDNGYATIWMSRASYRFDYPSQRKTTRINTTGSIDMGLPNWTLQTTGDFFDSYVEVPEESRVRHTRKVITRIKSKIVGGLTDTEIANFDGQHSGKYVMVNVGLGVNVPYLYMGTNARIDETNHAFIDVEFMTTAPVKAFPPGTFPGYSLAIPALKQLDEYVIKPAIWGVSVPSITVKLATDRYEPCPSIPWYP